MTTASLPIAPVGKLRKRKSAEWPTFADDVVPFSVAEMDFPLAEPVAHALREAIDRSDTGYPPPTSDLADAVSDYASRTWGWGIDRDHVRTVADVGIVETPLWHLWSRIRQVELRLLTPDGR